MKVCVYNRQNLYSFHRKALTTLVKKVLTDPYIKAKEVSVHFVSKEEICALHLEFFKDPTVTDCMSFPVDEPSAQAYLGDIVIYPHQAFDYLTTIQKPMTLENLSQEIALYIIHALLHLLGYNDIDPKDKTMMDQTQQHYLMTIPESLHLLRSFKLLT